MKKITFTNLLLLLIIIFSSCEDDDMNLLDENTTLTECESISKLGEILLLEESKKFLPYPDSISKLIFTNSQGEEFEGKVNYYETSIGSAFVNNMYPCPIDSQILIKYTWKPENKRISIEIDTLDIQLDVTIRPALQHEDYSQKFTADFCQFVLRTPIKDTKPAAQINILVNQRTYPKPFPGNIDYHEEYQIHDKIYEQVYMQSNLFKDKFTLYYSDLVGIVGFKDEINGTNIDLKFDRFE